MVDFTKRIQSSFYDQRLYHCAIEILNYSSRPTLAHMLQKVLFCATSALIWTLEQGSSVVHQKLQTRGPEIQDLASASHWLWHLGASSLTLLGN